MWQDILKTINITTGKTKTVDMPIIEDEDEDCKKRWDNFIRNIESANFDTYSWNPKFIPKHFTDTDYCDMLRSLKLFTEGIDIKKEEFGEHYLNEWFHDEWHPHYKLSSRLNEPESGNPPFYEVYIISTYQPPKTLGYIIFKIILYNVEDMKNFKSIIERYA